MLRYTRFYGGRVHLRRLSTTSTTRNQSSSSSLARVNSRSGFQITEPPHPTWQPGDGLLPQEAVWKDQGNKKRIWDLEATPSRDIYRLLTSAIVPRPIAFVSSLSTEGEPNLAPFSYFSMISHNPAMISVSFALSQRRPKDTRENILRNKEFTVNIISEAFIEAANSTSVESPADMDEWILSGLTMEPSDAVKPPLVKESAVGLECVLYSSQDIGPPGEDITTTVVLGLIKKVRIRESVLTEDGMSVDPAKLWPMARLGGTSYGRLLESFDLPRVSWKAVRNEYAALLKSKSS